MTTRKELIAKITMLDKTIRLQQMKVMAHKNYLKREGTSYAALLLVLIFVPCLWLGWTASKKRWITKTATHLVELITLTCVTYFRRQLTNYLIQK